MNSSLGIDVYAKRHWQRHSATHRGQIFKCIIRLQHQSEVNQGVGPKRDT